MTFTKNIERKYAEAARRRALDIEECQDTTGFADCEPERRECVAIWNAFCLEDAARLNAPKPTKFAQILPGVFVEAV